MKNSKCKDSESVVLPAAVLLSFDVYGDVFGGNYRLFQLGFLLRVARGCALDAARKQNVLVHFSSSIANQLHFQE